MCILLVAACPTGAGIIIVAPALLVMCSWAAAVPSGLGLTTVSLKTTPCGEGRQWQQWWPRRWRQRWRRRQQLRRLLQRRQWRLRRGRRGVCDSGSGGRGSGSGSGNSGSWQGSALERIYMLNAYVIQLAVFIVVCPAGTTCTSNATSALAALRPLTSQSPAPQGQSRGCRRS